MKRIITSLFLFSTAIVFAQAPSLQWARTMNGNLSGQDNPQKTCKDNLGNVYITGWNNDYDIFLAKYDNNGNQLYSIIYDGPGNSADNVYDVKADNSGNAYICGYTSTANGQFYPMVVKFDPVGHKIWERLDTHNGSSFKSMAFDNATNPNYIYAVGGYAYVDSMLVCKYNIATGSTSWVKRLEKGELSMVKTDNNGNPYVCGYTAENYAVHGTDGYVAKVNANGNFVWKQTFTGAADTNDYANNIEVLSGGGVIVAGSISDSVRNIPWVKYMRISTTGQVMWNKIFKVQDYMTVQSGLTGNNTQSAFYISSYIKWQIGFLSSTPAAYVLAINPNTGDSVFTRSYVDSLAYGMKPVDIHADNYGNIYLQGYISDGNNFGFLWKLNPVGTELCRTQYTTLFTSGPVGVQDAIGFSIDNSGHPMCVFQTYTGATLQDASLVRFSSGCGIDWEVFYNGHVNSYDYISGVKADNSGNSYVGGYVVNDNTGNDAVISKYDAQGNLVWSNLFDIDQYQGWSDGLGMDSQNNLYMVSPIGYLGTSGVIKVDASGNQVWTNMLSVQGKRLELDAGGNIYIGGDPIGYSTFNSNEFSFATINSAGAPGPSHTMSSNPKYKTNLLSMAVDNNSNSFLAGVVQKDSNYMDMHVIVEKFNNGAQVQGYFVLPGTDSLVSAAADVAKIAYNNNDGFLYLACSAVPQGSTIYSQYLLKIDPSNMSVNFTRIYNDTNVAQYHPYDMVISPSNEIYITGNKLVSNNGDFYVQKWDNSGNLIWERTFSSVMTGAAFEQGMALKLDASDNIYASGVLSSNGQEYQEYLVKITPSGNVLWTKGYNSYSTDTYSHQYVDVKNGRAFIGLAIVPRMYGSDDIGLLKYCDIPDPTLSSHGTVNVCNNSSYAIAAPAASSYQWSTGATSQSISVSTGGNYFCTVFESDGCNKNTDTLFVNVKAAPATPSICMVTVDDSSKHNLVLWDKTPYNNMGVIGFNIYREDLTNIYHLVGSVPFSNLSQFMDLDPAANPNANTKRYKLTAVDSCGNESQMSNYHNTIYIVSNGGGQFSWNQLYTIENSPNPVVQYILLRDDYNTNNWHAVDSTAGTQFNINDVNFATFQPTANWRVVTKWNITCTPTERLGGGNSTQTTVIKSKSNISNNRQIGINEIGNTVIGIMPNPAQNAAAITFPMADRTSVKLLNLVGETLQAQEILGSNSAPLDLSKLSAGVYLLQVENVSGKFVKRLVKE